MSATGERLGQNEALFRSINERIEAGTWPATPSDVVAFRCECAALGCNVLVEVTIADYESVRADSRQFILAPGHEIPGDRAGDPAYGRICGRSETRRCRPGRGHDRPALNAGVALAGDFSGQREPHPQLESAGCAGVPGRRRPRAGR